MMNFKKEEKPLSGNVKKRIIRFFAFPKPSNDNKPSWPLILGQVVVIGFLIGVGISLLIWGKALYSFII
tara:strand:- start:2202 stop:2408 length:207 start_codon:yes stop_codon:yes gene_type:complete